MTIKEATKLSFVDQITLLSAATDEQLNQLAMEYYGDLKGTTQADLFWAGAVIPELMRRLGKTVFDIKPTNQDGNRKTNPISDAG